MHKYLTGEVTKETLSLIKNNCTRVANDFKYCIYCPFIDFCYVCHNQGIREGKVDEVKDFIQKTTDTPEETFNNLSVFFKRPNCEPAIDCGSCLLSAINIAPMRYNVDLMYEAINKSYKIKKYNTNILFID